MQESFKSRVAKFWKSFSEEEYQIREMIDNKAEGETLLNFVDSILQIAFDKIYFEMGMNDENKYELILTPEGDRAKLMQLHYWLQYAPKPLWDKWNFYSSKPGKASSGWGMQMYGVDLSSADLLIYPELDADRHKANIKVYCPQLMTLDENKRYSMFFIFLDQYVGEVFTMEYVGYIEFIDNKLDNKSIQIDQFLSLIENEIENNGWPRFENPTEIYNGYKMEPTEKKDWKLREDVFSGYTSCMPLLNEYYNGENERFNDAKANGVHFGFLFFENINIPREEVVNFRGEIEDKILDQVVQYGIANSLGGATGFHFSYIDFIIYDFDAFMTIAKKVLSEYRFEEMGYSDLLKGTDPIMFSF